jgi:hypothetical protein
MRKLANFIHAGILIAILLLFILAAPAAADHSEFQVSIDTASNDRWNNPAIAMDDVDEAGEGGNFVIVWEENSGIYSGGRDIKARVYDASGVPLGNGPFLVNNTTAGTQFNPDIAMDSNGNFVVVWESSTNTLDSPDIFGQRFDSSGNKVGGEFLVNTETTGQQREPSIAMNGDGDFVVVYESNAFEGLGADIYARRFNSDGTPAGSEFRVHDDPANGQVEPDVAMDGDGNFVIVWRDSNTTLGHPPIFFRQFDSNGTAIGTMTRIRVNDTTTVPTSDPAVAINRDGAFVVVWEQNVDDPPYTSTGIYGKRYDENGEELGTEFLVNTSIYGWQRRPDVSMSDNGFVVAWDGFSGRSSTSIYAQVYNSDGSARGPEHRLNERFDNIQQVPSVAMDSSGRYAAAWRSDEVLSNLQARSIGIFARALDRPPLDNTAPAANDDQFSVQENETLTIAAPGVLSNDTDADGSLLSAINRTPPTSGSGSSFSFNTDGSFTYTPPLGFTGTTSFDYIAGDDTLDSNIATVTITIEEANTSPTANAGGPYSAAEGGPVTLNGTGSDDVDGDAIQYSWSVDANLCSFDDPAAASPNLTCDDNGSYNVTLQVSDGVATDTAAAVVDISNVAPTASFTNNGPVGEGQDILLDLSAVRDPSGTDLTAGFSFAFNCGDDNGYGAFSSSSGVTCQTTDNGSRTIKGIVRDKDGGQTEYTADVEVQNLAPTATLESPASVNEGSTIQIALNDATDASTDDIVAGFTYAFDCGDGSGYTETTNSSSIACATNDNGSRTIRAKLQDKDGGTSEYSTSVMVTNVAPTINAILAPTDPVAIDAQPVEVVIEFSDPGTADTHTTTINWNDGTNDTFQDPSPVTATHTYAEAGVYTLQVAVEDDDGGSANAAYEYIVLYDPSGGFVTGHGRLYSEAGWCRLDAACSDAQGNARFGFVSRYNRGATVPSGRTDFIFRAGNFDFESTAYHWLLVNQDGRNAQFRGEGLINGALSKSGLYQFMLWAGDEAGPVGEDTFRIKIWFEDGAQETVVYDNGFNQPISSGNIKVQTR